MVEIILDPLGEFTTKLVVSLVALLVAYAVKRILADKAIYAVAELTHQKVVERIAKPISKIVTVIIFLMFFFFVFWLWELNALFDSLLVGAGVLGIVVGFAAKDILGNVLGGIMIFFDQPFTIGDVVQIDNIFGKVEDIGLRSTKIKCFDNKFVSVPNGKVDMEIIENFSRYPKRRFEVKVGVDYSTDINKAKKAIMCVLKKMQKKDLILEKPEAKVFATDFDSSSISLIVWYWINRKSVPSMLSLKGDVIWEIRKEFKKEKIAIPFPQVTISNRKEPHKK